MSVKQLSSSNELDVLSILGIFLFLIAAVIQAGFLHK